MPNHLRSKVIKPIVNNTCTKCGEKLSSEDNFCTNCGEAASKNSSVEVVHTPQASKQNRKFTSLKKIIGVVVALIILTAIGGYYYIFMYKPMNVVQSCRSDHKDYEKDLSGFIAYNDCTSNKGVTDQSAYNKQLLLEIKEVRSQMEDIDRRLTKTEFIQELIDAQVRNSTPVGNSSYNDYSYELNDISRSLDEIQQDNQQRINCEQNGGRYGGGGLCNYF